jgi:gamma-glutamylaminecyclotransferase
MMIGEKKELVFAYGSLRKGFHNNHILKTAMLVSENARTKEACFQMRSLTVYPAVVEGGIHRIQGDVYEVGPKVLKALDKFEGNGLNYQRKLVDVISTSDERFWTCWMYIFLHDQARFDDASENPLIDENTAKWQMPVFD